MGLTRFAYNELKKIFELAGFNLMLTKLCKNTDSYEEVHPQATYAPWSVDKEFQAAYKSIKEHTMVDKYRCYELWQLVRETKKLDGAFIEVGAWRGGSGALIAYQARLNGIKDTVYLCDTFAGIVKAGDNDSSFNGGELADAPIKFAKEIVAKLNIDGVKILKGIFPEDTGDQVGSEKFRFCHIDVDVYQSAKDILEWVWPKLVNGGIVVFDDYGFQTCDGVTKFVDEERKKKDRLIIHNLNGHAVLIKIA